MRPKILGARALQARRGKADVPTRQAGGGPVCHQHRSPGTPVSRSGADVQKPRGHQAPGTGGPGLTEQAEGVAASPERGTEELPGPWTDGAWAPGVPRPPAPAGDE